MMPGIGDHVKSESVITIVRNTHICTRTTWRQVYRQFGVAPAKASEKRTVQNFRSEVLRELKKIKIAWPELNYTTAPGVLILHPSTPAIPPSSAPARLLE